MNNQKNQNQNESDTDLSKIFERKEKERLLEPSRPSEPGGIKKFWQETDEKTKLYIYLVLIIVSLTLTVFLLKSFFS